MADEKSGEVVRLIKFDGDEEKWHEWSVKALALAKTKGFRHVYAADTKPCSDAVYATTNDDKVKETYERNDKAFQFLILSCSGIAFGLVNQAKTRDLMDGDAYKAWTYLCDRYAPHSISDLIQLSGEFNKCCLDSTKTDPDEWFIQIDTIRNRMCQIDSSFDKKDVEIIAHIINKLPADYSEVITVVEGMSGITLTELKSKIRAFYKRKFKGEKNGNEHALYAGKTNKNKCKNCGKQGHRTAECRTVSNTAGKKNEAKGIKCFNCNKYAGHIAKDCPEPKQARNKKGDKKEKDDDKPETGMFVGMAISFFDNLSENNDDDDEVEYNGEEKSEVEVEYKSEDENQDESKDEAMKETTHSFDNDLTTKKKNDKSVVFCGFCVESENWLADTGATCHITMCDNGMTNVDNVRVRVVVGDGKEVLCTKRGDVLVKNKDTGEAMMLKKVLYAPSFKKNIVSVGTFVREGNCSVTMTGNKMTLSKRGSDKTLDFISNGTDVLYYYKGIRATTDSVMALETSTENENPKTSKGDETMSKAEKPKTIDINVAHDRFGHIGEAALRATLKSLSMNATGTIKICEGCVLAKAKAKGVPKVTLNKAIQPAERLYTDISGPYKKSIVGSNYWILVVDEFSGKSWSFFVKKKSQMAETVSTLLRKLSSADYSIKYLRCDNAGENTKGLAEVCDKLNIQIEFTAPYTPQQNGIVERKFVTIRDRGSAAMLKARFSEDIQGLLWAESMSAHTRLTNIVCNSSDMEKCPDWKFYGKIPTIYSNLIEFGRIGWVKLGKKQAKLDVKATKCVMIGYSPDHAGDTYRMYNPTTKKVINSRNVTWADWHGIVSPDKDMTVFTPESLVLEYDDATGTKILPQGAQLPDDADTQGNFTTPTGTTLQHVKFAVPEARGKNHQNDPNLNEMDTTKTAKLQRELLRLDGWTTVDNNKGARRSLKMGTNTTNPPSDDFEPNVESHMVYSTTLASDPGEPKGYKQAMNGVEKEKWIESMILELNNFYKRSVWQTWPRNKLMGRKPLGSRWVYKKKVESDKSIRFKSRVVAKGYVQIPGVDFTDSFAPVATDTSTRAAFAITLWNHSPNNMESWICEIVDVEAAFLEGDMEDDVFLEWPDGVLDFGFEDQATIDENCLLLNKAMYGTVQGALQFFKKLVSNLTLIGLRQSNVDPCVFYLKRNGLLVLLVTTHVDDCAVCGKPMDVDWFKTKLKKYFTIKEIGQLKKHLGVWYEWGEDKQGRYLESSMEDFVTGMRNDYNELFERYPKNAMTPALPGTNLTKNQGDTVLHKEYRSMVGKLLYFCKKVGPVCSNAVRELSQHLENPGDIHWQAIERLLGYICSNPVNRKIKLRAPKLMKVQDVVDSSFGDNPDTRRSTSAYLGTIGGSALVAWWSKGQKVVACSSTEAEYMTLSDGAKDTTFTANLLSELGEIEWPSILAEDNTGAIFLSRNRQVGARTKHIDVRYHFIREKVEAGLIQVDYVNTTRNPADLLSKNVVQRIHDNHAYDISNGTMDCWSRDQGV